MQLLVIIILIIFVIGIFVSFWLASFVMTGKRQTLDEAMNWQSDHYDTSFYHDLEKTDYSVTGDGDYLLHVQFLRNPTPTSKYLILSHGYTDNRMGDLKYVRMYLDLGFNCVIYDLRGHGENEATITTYGIREGRDLNALIADTRQRYPDLTILGLHGESLGAASTISALRDAPAVDFVVADSAFSDIENVLREGYRQANVPTILVDLADLGARLRYGVSIKAMNPIEALSENQIPILFIHGEDDTFIPARNSEALFERSKGVKRLLFVPGAGHAESIFVNPLRYRETVEAFLAEFLP